MLPTTSAVSSSRNTSDMTTAKELPREYLTNKSILAYLGGVSKDFIKELRESGELPYYKVRNTIFYKVSDVRRMIEKNKIY